MKAFNWLNKIFHHSNANYSHIPQRKDVFSVEAGEEKEERMHDSVMERDTEALLLHDVLFNGILAIGTFGHHHSLLPTEDEMKLEEENEGEENYHEVPGATVVVVATNKPLTASFNMKSLSGSTKEEMLTEVVVLREEAGEDVTKLQEKPLLEKTLPEAEEEVAAEKPRTTLADLFAADALFVDGSVRESFKGDDDDTMEGISKDTCCADKKQSKKKVEKPQTASTKRKLQRAMRKMMRKKIHPEQLNGGRSLKRTPTMVSFLSVSSAAVAVPAVRGEGIEG